MRFEVERSDERWMVSDGAARFGPYASEARASASAQALNEVREWVALSPAEIVDRQRL